MEVKTMAAKFIKRNAKARLFKEVVKLFEDDNDHLISTVIPGAYFKSYIDPEPDPSLGLVLAGKTAGAKYYVPPKYKNVFSIHDHGHWDYMICSPITGEEIIVSAHLGSSVEAQIFTK